MSSGRPLLRRRQGRPVPGKGKFSKGIVWLRNMHSLNASSEAFLIGSRLGGGPSDAFVACNHKKGLARSRRRRESQNCWPLLVSFRQLLRIFMTFVWRYHHYRRIVKWQSSQRESIGMVPWLGLFLSLPHLQFYNLQLQIGDACGELQLSKVSRIRPCQGANRNGYMYVN